MEILWEKLGDYVSVGVSQSGQAVEGCANGVDGSQLTGDSQGGRDITSSPDTRGQVFIQIITHTKKIYFCINGNILIFTLL
jgi:hypothetical protein